MPNDCFKSYHRWCTLPSTQETKNMLWPHVKVTIRWFIWENDSQTITVVWKKRGTYKSFTNKEIALWSHDCMVWHGTFSGKCKTTTATISRPKDVVPKNVIIWLPVSEWTSVDHHRCLKRDLCFCFKVFPQCNAIFIEPYAPLVSPSSRTEAEMFWDVRAGKRWAAH